MFCDNKVSNVVGFTREDLIQFFKRHSAIFQLHPDGCVSVKQDAVKALILKDMSPPGNGNVLGLGMNAMANGVHNVNGMANNLMLNGGAVQAGQADLQPPGIITSNGVVLRIFPKYGILNMENNEQVFFDIQSCQFETFNDLTTILHMGDRLYFNAVIGPRDGSTKWRSIKTWIKMKPQQQTATFDNLSSHSDADKSDDSSTSSSHGVHGLNGSGGGSGGAPGPYSTGGGRHHHSNLFYHNSFHGSFNGYNPSASPFQSATLNQFYLPQSPTPTTSTTANTPVSAATTGAVSQANEDSIVMSASNSNLSIASSTNQPGLHLHHHHHHQQTGEFNQYQLDSNSSEFIPSSAVSVSSTATPSDANNAAGGGANGGGGDESATLSSSSMSSSQLIHSSSANNLAGVDASTTKPTQNPTNHHMSTSKSIHSFSSADEKSKLAVPTTTTANTTSVTAGAESTPATTKFKKQSPDNISEKETISVTVPVVATNTTKQLVSIGCQTISTGDITVTDVYIE